jgi:hypothetical protein
MKRRHRKLCRAVAVVFLAIGLAASSAQDLEIEIKRAEAEAIKAQQEADAKRQALERLKTLKAKVAAANKKLSELHSDLHELHKVDPSISTNTLPKSIDQTSTESTLPPATLGTLYSKGDFSVGLNHQWLKPGTRIYFDDGTDDPGEIDLFKDGRLGINLDVLTISLDLQWKALTVGFFGSGGISSANSDSASDPVVAIIAGGIVITPRGSPFRLEAGYMQGFSADERLNGSQRDDGALFFGVSFDIEHDLFKKKPIF